jgi:hypothetical protein
VVTDTVPPTLTYAVAFQNTNDIYTSIIIVDVTFNKWLDAATATNAANYTISGVTVLGASLAANHRTVQLLLNTMPTLPVVVTVSGVKSLSGFTIAASSTTPINSPTLTFGDFGNPGDIFTFGATGIDPAYPSYMWITETNGYIVQAEGHDIWDNADGFNFGYELKTNDFDVVVRGVSLGKSHQNAKMGLMVRENLTGGSREWSVVNQPSSADGIQAVDASGTGQNQVDFIARRTNNLPSVSLRTNGTVPIPQYPNAWVRITRTNSVLTTYASSNAVNWVPLGRFDTAGTNTTGVLSNIVYVGICTTAHNNDGLNVPPYRFYNTAEYANYNSSFVQSVPIVPAVLSAIRSGNNINVSWTPAGGHLESSPALSGPSVNWVNIGSANPAIVPIGSGSLFLRVVNP